MDAARALTGHLLYCAPENETHQAQPAQITHAITTLPGVFQPVKIVSILAATNGEEVMSAGTDHHFSRLLTRHRNAAGLTQEQLAELANLSVRGISDLERGAKTKPHVHTVEALADALELTPEDRDTFRSAVHRERGLYAISSAPASLPLRRRR